MNTPRTPQTPAAFEDSELARLEHVEAWQAMGLVGLGAGGLALMLGGLGAMVWAAAHTLGRIFG